MGGACMSKSQVQQNASEKENSWNGKKGHMKLYSYSSQALIRWQILFWMMAILPKRVRKLEGDEKGAHVPYYTVDNWWKIAIICDLLGIPYTLWKTLFFSNINSFFSVFRRLGPFSKKPLGTLHQFWEWNRSEGCAHVRVMTIKPKLRVVLWRK